LRRAPADLALGPKLGTPLGAAGFGEVSTRVHLVQSVHEERIEEFVERLRGAVTTVAGAGALRDDELEGVAVRRRMAAIESDLHGRNGFSLHAVPIWRWVATRTG